MTRGPAALAIGIALGIALLGGCSLPGGSRPPMGGLEARYRLRTHGVVDGAGRRATATAIYQDLLSRSLFSRCRMVPHDSLLFDVRARRCGGLFAAVLGASRLFLEVEARPSLLRPALFDGRLGWFDLPAGPCRL